MFHQYFKNDILYLSEKTSFQLNDNFYKVKFKYLDKNYIGIIFLSNNECKIYSKIKIFNLNEIYIIKILSEFKLFDGAQIKFKKNKKILKGYIHYFDPEFFLNNNNLIIVDYKNYDISYQINFCDIISNDYSIIQ